MSKVLNHKLTVHELGRKCHNLLSLSPTAVVASLIQNTKNANSHIVTYF